MAIVFSTGKQIDYCFMSDELKECPGGRCNVTILKYPDVDHREVAPLTRNLLMIFRDKQELATVVSRSLRT